MAMAYFKLGRLEMAQAMLEKCRPVIEKMHQDIVENGAYGSVGYRHGNVAADKFYREKGFWHDWLINNILLQEALGMINFPPPGKDASPGAAAEPTATADRLD
jgi:hypothetical protein